MQVEMAVFIYFGNDAIAFGKYAACYMGAERLINILAHPENRVKAKTELIYWEVTSAVGGERWTREV